MNTQSRTKSLTLALILGSNLVTSLTAQTQFAPAETLHTGPSAASIAPADLNGDGYMDVAMGMARAIALAPGTFQGGIGPASTLSAGTSVASIQAVDLDGDLDPDLVVAPPKLSQDPGEPGIVPVRSRSGCRGGCSQVFQEHGDRRPRWRPEPRHRGVLDRTRIGCPARGRSCASTVWED